MLDCQAGSRPTHAYPLTLDKYISETYETTHPNSNESSIFSKVFPEGCL